MIGALLVSYPLIVLRRPSTRPAAPALPIPVAAPHPPATPRRRALHGVLRGDRRDIVSEA